jgi:glycosyltransferase involved in cell wall biosynthesis
MSLISIITVVYNSVATIEETIVSVLNQSYRNVEYIIIDGGSNDGTVEVVEKYANQLAYFVSEPDSGLYDAMNKGITASSGEWLLFLNSGDSLFNKHVLTEVFANMV